ncbi:glycoside hydrolase family 97 protein [Gaoshiqia sediminis]|uniref:Glycoside hydrolase family 97 protein n=1 Tax=Gaoshiqia sediminis TaxID=2986998 RepID=A0AA41YD65_9BACT|nr:glycoside hydrolase family 97 protein [Gaoshiqia sediminis]MCW0484538.1 glycoside hydrolase family 97 protein [Gaoshiqia sediminis]
MRKMICFSLFFMALLSAQVCFATANPVEMKLSSPNKQISLQIQVGSELSWALIQSGDTVIAPSNISLLLADGKILGNHARIKSTKSDSVNTTITAINYRKKEVSDNYNQVTVTFKGDYGVIFRAYNDGIAYRFFSTKKGGIVIENEVANFNFKADHKAWVPYVCDPREGDLFQTPFEVIYDRINISQFRIDSLAILPLLVDLGNQKKALVMETDLEDYPGMYLNLNKQAEHGFVGVFPKYPLDERIGGYDNLNLWVSRRADFIAKTSEPREFPWRVVFISNSDKELADNDMVQRLAAPSRIADASWIKPGKVAWDWWNNWNISHVDFRAGINTPTYKYYIDFASDYGVEYVVLDEGWYKGHDLLTSSDEIDLKEILDYAKSKNVGIMLWAAWHDLDTVKEQAFAKYAEMGVKGFKVDFFDRDDQKAMRSCYDIAELAAQHKILLDYHGMKPSGIQKTWPNVLNFEGVKGLENVKWARDNMPPYDVTLPFIRMMSGPMDYTPGAMRNATRENFQPSNSMPMSQGTRVHQMAMYVVFEAPLQMLCDNPTIYRKEDECTRFIAKTPTVTDRTVVLDANVSEYIVTARNKNDNWYVGALTNWDARSLTVDLSFLPEGQYKAEIFSDGINADRDATDYKREEKLLTNKDKLVIQLAPAGGWAARFDKL